MGKTQKFNVKMIQKKDHPNEKKQAISSELARVGSHPPSLVFGKGSKDSEQWKSFMGAGAGLGGAGLRYAVIGGHCSGETRDGLTRSQASYGI